ncbi:MAG: hypothetical protein ACR2OZ_17885 [Verrucomicrobiales bacterium]
MKEYGKIRGTLPTVKAGGRGEIGASRVQGRLRSIVPRRLADVATMVWGLIGFALIVVVGVTLIASVSNRPATEKPLEPVAAVEVTLPEKERVTVNLAAMHGRTKSGCQGIAGMPPRLRMVGSDLWEIEESGITALYNEAGRCYSITVEVPVDAEIHPIETVVARLGFAIGRITEPNQQILRAPCTGSEDERWLCEATRGHELEGFSRLNFRAEGVLPPGE